MYIFFFQVCEKGQSQNWQRVWLDSEKAWYMVNDDQWISYEDVDSAALKVIVLIESSGNSCLYMHTFTTFRHSMRRQNNLVGYLYGASITMVSVHYVSFDSISFMLKL